MSNSKLLIETLISASCGVLSHLCIFIRGEYHLQAPLLLRLSLIFIATLFFVHLRVVHLEPYDAVSWTCVIVAAYICPLFISMAVYRIFFHPLKEYPGPIAARLSKLYHAWHARNGQQYLFLERLHLEYGDFVRTGPNEVTIFTPKGIAAVYGPKSKCTKSSSYEMMYPLLSLFSTRSKAGHAARRRYWESSLSIRAVETYENRILARARALDGELKQLSGQPIDIHLWFEYFTYDTMAEIVLGIQPNLLENRSGKFREMIDIQKGGMVPLGPLTPVPWLFHLLFSLPMAQKGWRRLCRWADMELQSRLTMKPEKSNIISWMIEGDQNNGGIEKNYKWLLGDFITSLSAAVDPVLSTLTFLFYYLAQDCAKVEKLRAELQPLSDVSDSRALQYLPYLNALVNETLRLHPSVPSGGIRDAPQEGLTIDGHFVPGYTSLLVPQYSLGRLESCYERADEFIPERWYAKAEMVKDKAAYIPFNAGDHHCVGQHMGLMETRLVTALLVSRYNIAFAPGEDGTKFINGTKDRFIAVAEKLMLVLQERL